MSDVTDRAPVVVPPALPRDLLPRALSAGVLAVIAVACTWAGGAPFVLLVLAIGIVMSWEWSGIVRGRRTDAAFLVHAFAVAVASVLVANGAPGAATGVVIGAALAVLGVAPRGGALVSALGVLYVGLPAIALVWLRGTEPYGALAILFVFFIVWTTDTFAYVCGRLIGGPKLCPTVSPGKTWSGALGGTLFAAWAGAAFALLMPGSSGLALAVAALVLSVVAQIGDLGESALKRAFNVKNASELIPGHGGFMDRMDGVVTAATLAALIALVRGPQAPASSLLLWP